MILVPMLECVSMPCHCGFVEGEQVLFCPDHLDGYIPENPEPRTDGVHVKPRYRWNQDANAWILPVGTWAKYRGWPAAL